MAEDILRQRGILPGGGATGFERILPALRDGHTFGQRFALSLDNVRKAMQGVAATIYVFERVGGAMKRTLIDPFADLTKNIIRATEESRKFEYAVSGVAGGLGRARALNLALSSASRSSPLTVAELREAAKALAFTPSFAASLGLGSVGGASDEVKRFGGIAGRLSQIDPAQGQYGAILSLREAFEGDLISLRRRFGIQPRVLARLVDSDAGELARDPSLVLRAVERFADIFIPPEAYERTGSLVSRRVTKLKEAIDFSLARIGDAGVFDSVSERLGSATDQLFSYFEGPDFERQAGRISGSLDRLIGNIVRSVESLLRSITGAPADLSTVAGAVDTAGNALERIARLSDLLPEASRQIGPAVTQLAGKLGDFIDSVIFLANVARDPKGYVGGLAGRVGTEAGGKSANAATLDILKSAGVDVGAIGVTHYDARVGSSRLYRDLRQQGTNPVSAGVAALLQQARDEKGATPPIEFLDFRRLQPSIGGAAFNVYRQILERGAADESTLAKLRALTGAAPPTTQPFAGARGDETHVERLVRRYTGTALAEPNFNAYREAVTAGTWSVGATGRATGNIARKV